MRCAVLLATLAGCSDPGPGASIEVDGTALDLPDVTALQIDTFYLLSATAPDGAVLELGFPTSAMVGSHTCEEGRAVGLVTLSFTSSSGQRFSSVYPLAAPAHACSFDLDERGSTVALGAVTGSLADSGATATVQLSDGSFRAPVTR
jgi:hypothetical protein